MGTIKPAEVSAILLDELTNFDNRAMLDVKGTVLNVGDGVARVYGMRDVESGELVEFEKSGAMGMALNLEEDNVGVVINSNIIRQWVHSSVGRAPRSQRGGRGFESP